MIIRTGGVYRVLAPASVVAEALAGDGWTAVLVPPVTATADFYAELAAAAGFPAWFGANLDALADSLADLVGPTAVVLDRWTRLARAEPHDWPRILEVLQERTASEPPFAVVLV